MKQDEIIEMALRSGLPSKNAANQKMWWLKAFVKLVEDAAFKRWAAQTKLAVQDEREACLSIAESMSLSDANMSKTWRTGCRDVAEAIRARGEA